MRSVYDRMEEKIMKMKKLVSLALVLTCALTMTACGSKKEENNGETKEETETLIMATNAEFPPYEYYENGSFQGGCGQEEDHSSYAYTYIPTDPMEPGSSKKPEKKKRKGKKDEN